MYFRFGNFLFEPGECGVQVFSDRRINSPRGYTKAVKTMVCTVEVFRSTQAAIDARVRQIRDALVNTSADVAGLAMDSGTMTPLAMTSAGSIRGIQVEEIVFPEGDATNFATYCPLAFTLVSESIDANAPGLVDYAETITTIGSGGPIWSTIPVFQGPPKRYKLTDQSPVTVRQSGYAVGLQGFPLANSPILPVEFEDSLFRVIEPSAPQYNGGRSENFGMSWQYQFTLPVHPGALIPTAR